MPSRRDPEPDRALRRDTLASAAAHAQRLREQLQADADSAQSASRGKVNPYVAGDALLSEAIRATEALLDHVKQLQAPAMSEADSNVDPAEALLSEPDCAPKTSVPITDTMPADSTSSNVKEPEEPA